MRDFADQKKTFLTSLAVFMLIFIYLLVAGLTYINRLAPKFNIASYNFFAQQSDAVDGTIKKGSLGIYKAINAEDIKVDDIIVYNLTDKSGKKVYLNNVAMQVESISGDTFTFKSLDNNSPISVKLTQEDISGILVTKVPYLGVGLVFLNSLIGVIIMAVIGAFILIFVIMSIIKKAKKRERPLGLNLKKFTAEDQFIYQTIIRFFLKNSCITELGKDCIYVILTNQKSITNGVQSDGRLFGVLTYEKDSLYFKINYSLPADKAVVNREGVIRLEQAVNLPDAKARIRNIYNTYFSKASR